jgi:hypothetical protein
VTIAPASAIQTSSARLNGTVNPNANATTYTFQWGFTTAYGNTTGSGTTNNGDTNLTVTGQATALSAGTTYHYRLVATNANGTTYSADESFSTPAPPPAPATTTTSTTSTSSALLPEWGTYNGRTSQRWPITVRLNSSLQITRVHFSFTLTCKRRRHLSYNYAPLAAGQTWSLNADSGMGFSRKFVDNTGEKILALSGVHANRDSLWHAQQHVADQTTRDVLDRPPELDCALIGRVPTSPMGSGLERARRSRSPRLSLTRRRNMRAA